jgi:hypothetical protein
MGQKPFVTFNLPAMMNLRIHPGLGPDAAPLLLKRLKHL